MAAPLARTKSSGSFAATSAPGTWSGTCSSRWAAWSVRAAGWRSASTPAATKTEASSGRARRRTIMRSSSGREPSERVVAIVDVWTPTVSTYPRHHASTTPTPGRSSVAPRHTLWPCAGGMPRARGPTSSSRTSTSSEDRTGEPARSVLKNAQNPPAGAPDWNMAPSKQAPVVLTRRRATRPTARRGRRPRAPAAAAHVGARAGLGQGRQDRAAHDQRPRRVGARQGRLRQGRALAALHRARPTAGTSGRSRRPPPTPRASRASSRSSSTAPTARPSPSPASTSSGATASCPTDDPAAWLTTFTIITTAADPAWTASTTASPSCSSASSGSDWLDPDETDLGYVQERPRLRRARAASRRTRSGAPSARRATTDPRSSSPRRRVRARRRRRPDDRRGHRRVTAARSARRSARSRRRAARDAPTSSRPPGARGTVVLGHGAGGGLGALDLAIAREVLVGAGWARRARRAALARRRAQGRRVGPPTLDAAWVPDRRGARDRPGHGCRRPLVVGGRSAGARVACRTAGPLEADAGAAAQLPAAPARATRQARGPTSSPWRPTPSCGRAGHRRRLRHPGRGPPAPAARGTELLEVPGRAQLPARARAAALRRR